MLAVKIALRYLFAKKSHRAVNVIALVSMAGVAVATMAIVVVLSVFNGFTDLAQKHLAAVDPQIKIVPRQGKVIERADSLAEALSAMPQVAVAAPVIVERALLVAGDNQMPVVFKAADVDKARRVNDFDNLLIDGIYTDANSLADSLPAIQASVGVAIGMGLRPSPYAAAELYVPRRTGRINPANPAAAYRSAVVAVSGVVQVDQPEYDSDYIFIPLALGRRLLDYRHGQGTAIELKVAEGVDVNTLCRKLASDYPDFQFLDRAHQQADTFRMIALEKWVTFLMLIFILIVAAFNIISTMSLMVIEKRYDMATLHALGATRAMIKNIFMAEGWLITFVGGCIGIVSGVVLALLQQYFGLVKLDADPSALSIDVYPVRLDGLDVAAVAACLVIVGLLIGLTTRLFSKRI